MKYLGKHQVSHASLNDDDIMKKAAIIRSRQTGLHAHKLLPDVQNLHRGDHEQVQ